MNQNPAVLKLWFGIKTLIFGFGLLGLIACSGPKDRNAAEILGNPKFPAIAYGGYRNVDRSQAPSVADIKEDLKILDAMGIRILRTYHARLYDHTPNLLQAIREMKLEDSDFEMYVMLGAWMQCEGAWTDNPNHLKGDTTENQAEIKQAIKLAQEYPDIVKVIAVGNESMVHWAATYYVHPRIILKEVMYLQSLKADGSLPADLWITSSDNFASWGGDTEDYHLPALDSLIRAVDYLSVHSYPFHDTHYNPEWWWLPEGQDTLAKFKQIKLSVGRAIDRVDAQIAAVNSYLDDLGVEKEIHIGETGWASADNRFYGVEQSGAANEYMQMLYYLWIKAYCYDNRMACFYFEAFDEPWKDGENAGGSENHFGLFTVDGTAKAPLWNMVDKGVFEGLKRNGKPIRKTLDGDKDKAIALAGLPPRRIDQPSIRLMRNDTSLLGVLIWPNEKDRASFGADSYLTFNAWEGTCVMEQDPNGRLLLETGTGDWWGASLSAKAPLDLSEFENGFLEFSISGNTESSFEIGFQSGDYNLGSQRSAAVRFGPEEQFQLEEGQQRFRIPIKKIKAETDLKNISAPLYLKGLVNFDGKEIYISRFLFRKS